MIKSIEPIDINGTLFYRVRDFAHIVKKSENTIYRLTNHGNVFRRMKCEYGLLDGVPLIPATELTAFPFTGVGRYPMKEVGHYDEDGNFTECSVCSLEGVGHCPNTKE
jgi:hypothetical protein